MPKFYLIYNYGNCKNAQTYVSNIEVLIYVLTGLDKEMLRLWEEMSPLHQFDYDMDEVYLEIGEEVCNNNVVILIV